VPGAIGLSSSTVSRKFIRASAARLKAPHEGDLSGEDFLVVFLDGKSFAQDTLVVTLGADDVRREALPRICRDRKRRARSAAPLASRSLLERGLDISRGVLVIMGGSKGLRAAVRKAFERYAMVQLCQWHRRENVVSSAVRRWIAGRAPTSVIAGSRAPCSTSSRGCVG
jgi:transposase-like protein